MQVKARAAKKRNQQFIPLLLLVTIGFKYIWDEKGVVQTILDDMEEPPRHQFVKESLGKRSQTQVNESIEQEEKRERQMLSSYKDYRLSIPDSGDFDPDAPTILVQLGGNTFNNIAHVARGLGLSLLLEREYQINATIVLKQQKASVAEQAEKDVKQCFPFLRPFEFRAGTTSSIEDAIKKQKEDPTLKEVDRVINTHNNRTLPLIAKQLPAFLDKYRQGHTSLGKENGNVNLPLLYAWRLTCSGPLMDKYYDDFRRIFAFDRQSCCAATPDPDESVFHYRNYHTEMSGSNGKHGFIELGAERVANELFAHLKEGDKVAIVSRYEEGVGDYLEALQKRGIQARLVTGQTGMQDFCFLMQAQKEIVGTTRSSFFMYAGFLSQAKTVRAYLASTPDSTWGDLYEWTHPTLKDRFRYHSFDLLLTGNEEV